MHIMLRASFAYYIAIVEPSHLKLIKPAAGQLATGRGEKIRSTFSGTSPRFEPQRRPQRRQEGSPVALAALVRGLKMKLGERAGEHACTHDTHLSDQSGCFVEESYSELKENHSKLS